MVSDNKLNQWDRTVIVALGSNLPGHYASSRALLEAALTALERAGLRVVGRSSWWRSRAWPDPSDPPFLNGVAVVETGLPAAEALACLHAIEAAFGRRRNETNAPRTLDLDLIAYGRQVSEAPALPHPRAHERLFVMGPLAEIAPGWVHPILGATAAELMASASVGLDAGPISPQDQTMNGKQPGVEEEAFEWDGPPMDDASVEAWIERNKEPLKKLIAEAEEDIVTGRVFTLEEVEAELDRFLAERRDG